MVWDEAEQKWLPRYGYGRANNPKDTARDWLVVAKPGDDGSVDPFEEKADDRRKAQAKQKKQEARNQLEAAQAAGVLHAGYQGAGRSRRAEGGHCKVHLARAVRRRRRRRRRSAATTESCATSRRRGRGSGSPTRRRPTPPTPTPTVSARRASRSGCTPRTARSLRARSTAASPRSTRSSPRRSRNSRGEGEEGHAEPEVEGGAARRQDVGERRRQEGEEGRREEVIRLVRNSKSLQLHLYDSTYLRLHLPVVDARLPAEVAVDRRRRVDSPVGPPLASRSASRDRAGTTRWSS